MPLPGMVGNIQMFLLGDVFLRNFYSVYDFRNQKVRLAVNEHSRNDVSIHPVLSRAIAFWEYTGIMLVICIISIVALVKISKRDSELMLKRVHNEFILS